MDLQERFKKEVIPQMKERFKLTNNLAVARIEKVVLNLGLGKDFKDEKKKKYLSEVLTRITGQKPLERPARKSISSFKIRKGNIIALKVTLRGKRMYHFLEKLINVALPRTRDFRGLKPSAVDEHGQFTLGIREFTVFPEINPDEVEYIHGLEVSITTTARRREEGFALLKLLGFPFMENE